MTLDELANWIADSGPRPLLRGSCCWNGLRIRARKALQQAYDAGVKSADGNADMTAERALRELRGENDSSR